MQKSVLGYLALPWLSPYPKTSWSSRAWSLVAVLNFGPLVAFSIGENSRALAGRLRMESTYAPHIAALCCLSSFSAFLPISLAHETGDTDLSCNVYHSL